MSGFQTFWEGLDWSVLTDALFAVIPSLLCITLHELSHGAVAYLLGDRTAKNAGRLTLNPIRHIDPMGLLMMAVFHFGWAKPVPVDMRSFKNPRAGMAITALAGPLSNLLITIVMLFFYGLLFPSLVRVGTAASEYALYFFSLTAQLSLYMAVFNILPISPLDGSKVLFSFLNDRQYATLMRYERYGMILLLVLVATRVLSNPLSSVTDWIFERLFVFAEWGYGLASTFIG